MKILLVHPEAEFMQDRKITIAADCAVVVDKEIVERFGEEPLLIGCPMLEDPRRVFEKLKFIMRESNAEEIDVYTMEVPCCHAIHLMVDRANDERESMGKEKIKLNRYIVRVSGRVEPYSGKIDHEMREAEARAHRGR